MTDPHCEGMLYERTNHIRVESISRLDLSGGYVMLSNTFEATKGRVASGSCVRHRGRTRVPMDLYILFFSRLDFNEPFFPLLFHRC